MTGIQIEAGDDSGAVLAREGELDALAGILPFDARERLATLLTDGDVATLKHLIQTGMGANTLRALASDLGYLEAWCRAATGKALPWPASEALALRFVAHHLWDAVEREADPNHGMPHAVADDLRALKLLRVEGPHAPATGRRRLAHWSTLHRFRGLDGPFNAPRLRTALALAARASRRPRLRKSERAVTVDVIEKLLATCPFEHRLADRRDRALLLIAFASGGRWRSEVARLRVEDLIREAPIRLDGANISKGAVFRRIDRWGRLGPLALDPQSVNAMLKRRCQLAGLDPKRFSAHGLRSGFMTEAGRRGVLPRPCACRSVQQAARYYNEAELDRGLAVRLL